MSYLVENISDKCCVYRQVLPFQRKGPKKRRFPNEAHFELRKGELGLSVNWDKYMNIESNYILIALTQNQSNGKFQEHTAYKIFKYPVSLFRSIEKIDEVVHKPIFNGNPSPVGKPNNRSHAEVIYENDMEIFVKLSDYCLENYDNAYCEFDVNSINDKVKELKALLNNTPYHSL